MSPEILCPKKSEFWSLCFDFGHCVTDLNPKRYHQWSYVTSLCAQVAWLGFPGGVGGGLVDYLVGDPVVSPVDHAAFFLESLAFLPSKVCPHGGLRGFRFPSILGGNSDMTELHKSLNSIT